MVSAVYDMVIERLIDQTGYPPRGHGHQRNGRCPAHDDRKPSLSIGLGRDGAVLLHCQAGCPPEEVWAALGLLARDLFERKTDERARDDDWIPCHRDGHHKLAEYLYRDEHGTVLYGVVRCDQKCFRQWRPDPTTMSGRRWKLKDHDGNYLVRLVPYRLPEMLAAIRDELVIWCVEGEKDVEALRVRGCSATCNSMGAGSWRPEYAEHFHGADVVICADNDPAGKRHANKVFTNLRPVARSIEVVLPRHGKDASDHFAAGGRTGDFIGILDTTLPLGEPPGLRSFQAALRGCEAAGDDEGVALIKARIAQLHQDHQEWDSLHHLNVCPGDTHE